MLKRCVFLLAFYVFPQPVWVFVCIIFYIYIVIFSILCIFQYFEGPKIFKEMWFSIGSNKNHLYKSINALLDLPLQLQKFVMKWKKQPLSLRGTPVSLEILAKLRNIWKRFFWNCFNTTIRITKCWLNLFKSIWISCGCERVKMQNCRNWI